MKRDSKLQESRGATIGKREEEKSLVEGKEKAKNENASGEGGDDAKITMEEIAKDLKKVKRQNTITHWLLSAMIVLTVTWQLSEVSLILKVKDGMSHPFRSFGSILTGMLRPPGTNGEEDGSVLSGMLGPPGTNGKEAEKHHHNNHVEAPHLDIPSLNMPEFPHFELPDMGFNREKH